VARSIFAFAADKDGQVITQTKNSLGLSNLPSLSYRLEEAIVPTGKGDARVGRFVLEGESARTVEDVLAVQSDLADQRELTRAEEYLRKGLGGGPRPTKDVEAEAREVHGISKRTLDRARKNLNIAAASKGTSWWIALPEHEDDLKDLPDTPSGPGTPSDLPAETAKSAKSAKSGIVGNVAKSAKRASPGAVGRVGRVGAAEPYTQPDLDGQAIDAVAKVTEYVTRFPGCTAGDLRKCKGGTAAKIAQARLDAIGRGLIHTQRDGHAVRHYPGPVAKPRRSPSAHALVRPAGPRPEEPVCERCWQALGPADVAGKSPVHLLGCNPKDAK
jgi:hypothetical protein